MFIPSPLTTPYIIPRPISKMSTIWSSTEYSVGSINTILTIMSLVIAFIVSYIMSEVVVEIRRYMIIKGERDSILLEPGIKNSFIVLWRAVRESKFKMTTLLVVVPAFIVVGFVNTIEFSTSGMSTDIIEVDGDKVSVLGLLGENVEAFEFDPTLLSVPYDNIETPLSFEDANLILFNDDSRRLGLNILEPTFLRGNIFAGIREKTVSEYPFDVTSYMCLDFEISGVNTYTTGCKDSLIENLNFAPSKMTFIGRNHYLFTYKSCSNEDNITHLGGRNVRIVDRVISTIDNREDGEYFNQVNAKCGSLSRDAVTEICLWVQDSIFYIGEAVVYGCDEGPVNGGDGMAITSLKYLPFSGYNVNELEDAFVLLLIMLVNMGEGFPRGGNPHIVGIIDSIVKMESMQWGSHVVSDTVEIVRISIASWVLAVAILVLAIPSIIWGIVRYVLNGKNSRFFVPIALEDWSACAARDINYAVDSGYLFDDIERPNSVFYDKVYAFGKSTGNKQKLGWMDKEEVSPAIHFGKHVVLEHPVVINKINSDGTLVPI